MKQSRILPTIMTSVVVSLVSSFSYFALCKIFEADIDPIVAASLASVTTLMALMRLRGPEEKRCPVPPVKS